MIPANPKLYAKIKKLADQIFPIKTSVYKSAWIIREYKKQNGTFLDKKNPNQGLLKWFKDQKNLRKIQ